MSKTLKNLMVVLVAVLMFFSSAFTPVRAEEAETDPVTDEVTEETIESDEPETTIEEEAEFEANTEADEAVAETDPATAMEETAPVEAEDNAIEENLAAVAEAELKANLSNTFDNVLSEYDTNADDDETDDEPGVASDAPANSKKLIPNGDGTYTLALNVTGTRKSSSSSEISRANVILVMDTSSSMNNSAGATYYTVIGTPLPPTTANYGRVTPTFYRPNPNGSGYVQLYYRNNAWRINNTNNATPYNGTFYTNNRMWAEIHALTDDGGIIDSLLAQNVPTDDAKKDIIEIALVDFNTEGNQLLDFTTNKDALKAAIRGLSTGSGTNWESALSNANSYATSIKALQEDEPVYVVFMTDGQPTDPTGAVESSWTAATDDARTLISPTGAELYGLFTWGDSGNTHYLSSLIHYAYTGSGTSTSDLEADYAKYYKTADSTDELIEALKQIVHEITVGVGYTNVELEDGVTEMTASSVKTSAGGQVTGLKYYRSGGAYGAADPDNGNFGTEWEDAPDATINEDGEVDWNLGNLVLEDGVTYTVTFSVWPKQESIDLVANLNNGIISYNDLTDKQKEQIHVSGSHYTLKTNTDYPTVTYSTVTTTTIDGKPTTVTSDPVTENIKNPDPVGLAEEQLNAKKIWEDSLQPSQRENFAGTAELKLLVDGNPYFKDDEGNPLTVTLTEDSDWTYTNYISIAPGLFVTEESPAYDPNAPHFEWDGVMYAMLETGHEYVFEELSSDEHYELTAYTHHPMIMGTDDEGNPIIKDVLFTKDDEGNLTGIETIQDLEDSLSATNTLKGGINITKEVKDALGNVVDTDETFTITVNVTDPDGNALPLKTDEDTGTQYNIDYRIYYGEKNPAYENSGDQHRSGHIFVTGTSFEAEIYVGDTIRVVNVETNAKFNVTEALPNRYERNEFTYKIAYGTGLISAAMTYEDFAEEHEIDLDKLIDEDGDTSWYAVPGNCACYATVTNILPAEFYIYHSSEAVDGDLETISLTECESDGSYDLHAKTKEGTLYGGYYMDYAGKGDYADDGKPGTTGVAYNGWNVEWENPETVDGTNIYPIAGETYYIKEVPTYYLLNYYQINYISSGNKDVKAMYLISAVDDLNYEETGFDLQLIDPEGEKDAETAHVVSELVYRNVSNKKSVSLKAKTVFRLQGLKDGGYLTYYELTKNTDYFAAGKKFTVQPYWITPDGIRVSGTGVRTVTIDTLTKSGISKIDN